MSRSSHKPSPHQQQCRSNVRLCCQKRQQCRTSYMLKFRPFDKVECCFDIVAGVDRAMGSTIAVQCSPWIAGLLVSLTIYVCIHVLTTINNRPVLYSAVIYTIAWWKSYCVVTDAAMLKSIERLICTTRYELRPRSSLILKRWSHERNENDGSLLQLRTCRCYVA